ncbi:uncharacterized protein LOC123675100 isoform X1 [Harmonia axyridis]|uniref:uncharacterized protein LOC123675100 isoform X1 n=1 Tax=Harmonia axyridis TaxID=115357 RepID=UPI001E275E15|nr:uncharacterized protein LOC123675100 isoform X1 [Harmonia axyridis]
MSPPGVSNHPILMSIATPSRDSMPCTTTKGLLNEPGQNNCFLNSAVQVLWHLDIFRRSFRDLMGHACMADSCIFCALKELFSQLQFSNESALPPDALRKALAESFSDQQRFQLGFMDDAAECFENILLRIHMHIAHGESQDMCNAQHCIPHQKFAMTLVEQTVCGSCGATSEPLSYTQMVHYVSTSTLVYQVRNGNARASPYNHASFGQLLRKAGNMGDVRMCPSHCGAVIQITRTLMNWPEIVSIGLVWNSERPSLEHIMEVFSTIGTTMLLGDVFTSVMEKKWTENCTHNLVGVVTYYGKHYSTFFFHTKLRVWIYFDDATVRQVGPHWEQVVEKCRKGRYQPLLLLYATPDGTPVNTENAPKQITQICPQKSSTKKTNPPQNFVRRSVTPSPEKPNVGSTRRAITPNPDCALNQKPPLPKPYNEYQNLSVIQNNLHNGSDVPDGYVGRKEPYVRKIDMDAINKPSVNIHRTLSNGSSSGIDGMSDSMNFPRRRDSGNWSGDRNSASSASSTTMENPYLYLVGKVPHGNVPDSPTLVKSDSSSAGSAIYDAGYDSYSLSSNDSSTMTTLQHMMKIGHLAKIPEDYNNMSGQGTQSCDVLCDEADELLVKSRQLEDEHDLVLALALCNAAATKARAAMNAPYNNPQTLTLARMKHNTCIMRARSLHRRMTQTAPNKETAPPEIRHTREGSSGSGKHSRQNSRDKGQHSRQNSKELLTNLPQPDKPTHKNIEIYATLPKRKDLLKNRIESINIDEPIQPIKNEKEPLKETRSFFSRSKQKDNSKREKRSRSEDRSKRVVEFTLTPEIIDIKPKVKEEKNDKQEKEKDGKSKKQHKIRRKLLMGGLIKRKNRSMPDLTDANPEMKSPEVPPKLSSVDDSNVGLKENVDNSKSMSGYLSEGHLEFSANNTNPNLKKSKLMKKSFYASAGKILSVPKVPPPPPLRTTSQLTASKPLTDDEIKDCKNEYQNLYELNNSMKYDTSIIERLRFEQMQQRFNDSSNSNNSFNTSSSSYGTQSTTLVTTADVHREPKGSTDHLNTASVDEVDCPMPKHLLQSLDLPPYPSPAGSTVHSRQASEDFPPPPPPLDLSALDEHLPQPPPRIANDSLQGQLQNKREQIFSYEPVKQPLEISSVSPGGDTWLKELQAKQAALKIKRIESFNKRNDGGCDVVNTQRYTPGELSLKAASVRDLTSKFEIKPSADIPPQQIPMSLNEEINPVSIKKHEMESIAPEQIAEEIREVERINASLQETFNCNKQNAIEERKKNKLGKKKSVSFCDQVILVATAEDQEDDSYIPNPILERVLRSAINKPETSEIESKTSSEDGGRISNDFNNVSAMEEHKTSSENLFDITMRNTMENSKIANPNLITKITDTQKVVAPIQYQSAYSSVAFAHNRNTIPTGPTLSNGVPSTQPLYSGNQYSQFPSGVPQQPPQGNHQQYDSYGPSYQENAMNSYNYVSQNPSASQQSNYPQQVTYPGHPQHPSYISRGEAFDHLPHQVHHQQQLPQNQHKQQPLAYHPQQQSQVHHPQQQSQVHHPQQQPLVHHPQQQPLVHHQQPQTHHQLQQELSHPQQSQQIHQAPSYNYSLQNSHQTPSYLPASAHYNHPYQQKSHQMNSLHSNHPSSSYPQNVSPQSSYPPSSPAGYMAQQNPQNSYGSEGICRQSPNILQQNYNGQHSRPVYQHPPQPVKSHSQLSRTSAGVYQSVPYSNKQTPNPVYQRVPSSDYNTNQNPAYQRIPSRTYSADQEHQKLYDPYQSVPSPYSERDTYNQVPPLAAMKNFDGSNIERTDPLMSKAVVTPILVNNANNSIPDKTKCNLCRKKVVVLSNLYCTDCEYYMSRFKPKV